MQLRLTGQDSRVMERTPGLKLLAKYYTAFEKLPDYQLTHVKVQDRKARLVDALVKYLGRKAKQALDEARFQYAELA